MFKPSPTMMARLRLTTKQVNGGYYKGTRTGSMGHFRKGKYVIDWKKVRTYVAPDDLESFDLTPFVSKKIPAKRDQYVKQIERNGRLVTVIDSLKGQDYINVWGEKNAEEVVARENAENEAEQQTSKSRS